MPNPQPGLRQCIWCEQIKYFNPKKKLSDFDTEHVLPESFGKFSPNLTLHGLVCKKCNNKFGSGLDQILGRGGIECYKRFKYGHKPSDELLDFDPSSLSMKVIDNDPSWDGAEVSLTRIGNTISEVVSTPIGIRQKSGKWLRLTEDQLDALESKKDLDLSEQTEICFYTTSEEDKNRLVEKIKNKGLTPLNEPREEIVKSKAGLIDYTLTQERQRAITKIAVNYLAKICERKFEQILFSNEIKAIKQYVLTGASPGYNPIVKSKSIIAIDKQSNNHIREGHLISIGFYNYLGRNQLICNISLYNWATQAVFLSRCYNSILIPIRHGHHWDINKKTCREALILDTHTQGIY